MVAINTSIRICRFNAPKPSLHFSAYPQDQMRSEVRMPLHCTMVLEPLESTPQATMRRCRPRSRGRAAPELDVDPARDLRDNYELASKGEREASLLTLLLCEEDSLRSLERFRTRLKLAA